MKKLVKVLTWVGGLLFVAYLYENQQNKDTFWIIATIGGVAYFVGEKIDALQVRADLIIAYLEQNRR